MRAIYAGTGIGRNCALTFIALQICNLFTGVYLIKRFLFKPIINMLAKRKELADAQIQEAVKSKRRRVETRSLSMSRNVMQEIK